MALWDPQAFTPQRAAVQRATARLLIGPVLSAYHRLTVEGRQNVPKEGPVIIVANHLSLIDPPLIAYACDRPMAYIAKQELFAIPVISQVIRFYGAISVDRESPDHSTFKAARFALEAGWALAMFIEGTRQKKAGILGTPHRGPAFVAHMQSVPLLPVGIVGTDRAWGPARARIGKPLSARADLDATTWELMESLADLTGFALPPRTVSRLRGNKYPSAR